MTYDPTSPNAQQSPRDQTTQVRTNFSEFQNVFNNNHTNINTLKQGDHEAIIFKKQTLDRGVTNTLDVVYAKDAASQAGTQPQLFLQIPKFLPKFPDTTDAPNTPMQLTYNMVNTAGPVYQSFLAGGYLIYFGMVSSIVAPITLSPAPTKILAAIAYCNVAIPGSNAPFNISTVVLNNSQFQIFSNVPGIFTITWLAIATA
jgi:hypothetical protein